MQSKAEIGQERTAAHKEALHRLEFAWASDPGGYEAPALLCKVLSQMTLGRLRTREQAIGQSTWVKLGSVCARAKELMNSTTVAARDGQAGQRGPPAALLSEVTKHVAMVSEHADEVTIALLGGVASGDAIWCSKKRIYQQTSVLLPPNHKNRNKGRRKQRKQPKQEL